MKPLLSNTVVENSNLTSVTSPGDTVYNATYVYDDLNRLTNATGSYGTAAYTYDNVGNRLTKTLNSDTDTYGYVTDTNRLDNIAGAATVNYTYDSNGNVTGIGDRTLVYNQNNRLIRVEENSAVLGEYTYNGLGQRAIKEVDGVETIFHYDFDGKLIAEGLADGTITKEYLYKYNDRLAMVDVASGNLYLYLNDYLGTPQMLTDESNTVVWEALYKPFGQGEVNPNSSITNNLRLPGQYYDEETGFHYNYFRYYDPSTGRYLRPDPIGLAGMDPNLYGYVLNNPVNFVDPYGLINITKSTIGLYKKIGTGKLRLFHYLICDKDINYYQTMDTSRMY